MEPKSASLGSSIEVPCVQEMAKGPLTAIPHRYVRSDQEPSIKEENILSQYDIPVINLQNLVAGDSENPELQKLHCACKDWGFFQLTDHGVSSTLINKVKLEIKNLFDLPMEEKKKFWQKPGNSQGFGQLFVVSEEQKLDWGDLFYMMVLPSHTRPDFFSNLPCSFRETLDSYSAEVNNISKKLLNQMEKALNTKNPEELSNLYDRGSQAMRLNFYPPCPRPDLVMGLTPHSDAGGLTILLQLNEVEGLQINKYGKWIPVKPLHNAFVINIGDSLEIATNGVYKSIEHRAVVNSEQERLSIATFHIPDMDGLLSPAPSLITPETPSLFTEIRVVDFYKRFFENKLHGKSHLDYQRIQKEEHGES